MKNMKLGTKIAMGFGILVLIATALGTMSIWNMKSVSRNSTILAKEYVPEVGMANVLRGAANRVMYEMRGFGFTEEKQYYENTLKEIQAVEKSLADGKKLQAEAKNLISLKGQLEVAENALNQYKNVSKQMADVTAKMAAERNNLYAAGEQYMINCNDFLASQNVAFKKDLADRQNKIRLVSEVVNIGTSVRVLNFKSQATGEPRLLEDAIEKLGEIDPVVADLRKVTRSDVNIKQIDDMVKAATNYKSDMRNFLKEFQRGSQANQNMLENVRKQMDENAAIYVKNCTNFLEDQQRALDKEMNERHEKITMVNDIIDMGNATRIAAWKSMAKRDPSIIKDVQKNFDIMGNKFETLRAITRNEANIKQIERTREAANAYKTAMNDFLTNWILLQDLGTKNEETGKGLIAACVTTADAGMAGTTTIAENAVSALNNSTTVMIIGLFIAIILGVVVAVFITKSITGPLNRVIDGLHAGAEQVTSASSQVSSASQSLAEGSSEQAAAIEETSSSLEEMSSMTKQNAEHANQADNLMKEANHIVTKANASMSELTTSMKDITKASEETSKIIKTIDEIAFQTNLLALNAAVEAARAGEAGAGFAVVADEVRNLAMRAADAAKNTANLIEGTVKKINDGSNLVTSTNDAFTEVAESARKVGALVGEIAAASKEQAQGIEQVNKAVVDMDKVTQQNAANAEESASASEEMNAQASQMMGYVNEMLALIGGDLHKNEMGSTSRRTHKVISGRTTTKAVATLKTKNDHEKIIPLDTEDDFADF
ncbi:MAG: MCP four helix bundle domain-containing protein [Proteobacteria bacterium]|nr:MCP four helix bundle domain-containing protein [Pseudomonadota bacterium]